MDEQVKKYIDRYPPAIIDLFNDLRKIIFDSVSYELEEKLWAKLPSYYADKSFVRLIPFKDHVNVEARATILYKDELTDYKITPKGILQIYLEQDIPTEILRLILAETFER